MDEALIQVNIKLPRSLYDRLEAHRLAQPYSPTRAWVVRTMIERALDADEARRHKPRKDTAE